MPQTGSYLKKTSVIAITLGSFFVFTLPFSIFALLQDSPVDFARVSFIYFLILGSTHFLLTFALFMQNQNLRYFQSTHLNKIIYFVIPVIIFLGFNTYRSSHVALAHPQFDFWFVAAIRLFNFYHFGRQSFGVLQLFKRSAGVPFPPWQKAAESTFFYVLILLLLSTFITGGKLSLQSGASPWLLTIAVCLFVFILIGFSQMKSRAVLVPVAYFVLQSLSASFAVYSTAFYIFALGMHYVEYQVLMYPRCFHAPLEDGRVDRVFAALRSSKWIFYLLLLMAAAVFSITAQSAGDAAASGTSLSLFDALFVFHFFIEAFVWKFSNPFYRKQLEQLAF